MIYVFILLRFQVIEDLDVSNILCKIDIFCPIDHGEPDK